MRIYFKAVQSAANDVANIPTEIAKWELAASATCALEVENTLVDSTRTSSFTRISHIITSCCVVVDVVEKKIDVMTPQDSFQVRSVQIGTLQA